MGLLLLGDTSDLTSVAAALDGAYGAWVNIDGFTVGEQREIYAGMRIFELAKQTKSLRHYIWSSLDYNLKVRNNIHFHLRAEHRCTHCRLCRKEAMIRNTGVNITMPRAASPSGWHNSHPS